MKTSYRKDVSMDWKKFGSIELKRLSEEIRSNNSVLNELGAYIAFCDIEEQIDTQQIDENFVKLFKCSQVLIDFLLNEFNEFKNTENERKSQNNLIRENKKLRKLLEIQQKAMTYSRTFNGQNVECPHCPKVFFDPIFLKTHVTRRHPNESLDSEGMLSLTDKIKDYQKVLIGDNQCLDKFKDEIQVLTQKLAQTEADLISERDERIKLEERMVYVMKVRDKEIQQTLKEELEEFKFVRRERDIEENIRTNDKKVDIISNRSDEQNPKALKMHKIEEIIAIQAKEMIKLGNNVQKLVTHLTDSSEEGFTGKLKTKSLNKIKSKVINEFQESKNDGKKEKIQTTKTNERNDSLSKSFRKEFKDLNSETTETTIDERKENKDITHAFNEVQCNLNEKLVSLGIDIHSIGITDQKYSDAIKKLNEERNLLIQQNRFDYDFNAIEQQIRKFVDKKVIERIGGSKMETTNHSVSEVSVEKKWIEKDIQTETQKANKHSVEAIVHSMPINEIQVLANNQSICEDISDSNSDPNQNSAKKPGIQEKSPKPVLKSIISDRKTSDKNEGKANQRRIRFSEQRIEHQLSPDESSEDTSEEYCAVISDSVAFESNKTQAVPIPAQRTRKTDLTLNLKSDETNDDSSDDNIYEIDDQLMNEILHTNTFANNEDSKQSQSFAVENSLHPTKVQELAQMIEQQLNKRSAAHKKPPIGSVDVMTERKSNANNSSVRRIDFDSEDSD